MASIRPTVLVITADEQFGCSIQRSLVENGYDVRVVASLRAAASVSSPLLLLDRRTVSVKQVREVAGFSHVICLCVQPSGLPCNEDDCAQDLDDGADWAICEQSNRQIIALVRAAMRRLELDGKRRWAVGGVELDFDRHEVRVNGQPVELRRKQYQILELLLLHPTRVITKDEIVTTVWGEDADCQEHTLAVHIYALRRKIERDPTRPRFILTVQGIGYKLRHGSL